MKMKKNSNGNSESQVPNIISQGTRLTGKIESDGDVRIDGWMSGSIRAKGKVVIGDKGYVEGEVNCLNTDISGEVKATLTVSELIVLKSSAKFTGDIVTKKISIEPGATFTGSCTMEKGGKLNRDEEEQKKEQKKST